MVQRSKKEISLEVEDCFGKKPPRNDILINVLARAVPARRGLPTIELLFINNFSF
jgi:hypothetical protein